MGKAKLQHLMQEAFKSLTPISIEILSIEDESLKVRTVSNLYAQKNSAERVELLTILLLNHNKQIFNDYSISFDPLTESEYSEWFGSGSNSQSASTSLEKVAAKNAEV